jgi:hypothetical protein
MRVAIFALLFAAPAWADDGKFRSLRVVNDTGSPVNQLFVSGGRSPGWRAKVAGIVGPPDDDRDRLESKMLPRGGSIVINLKGERCRYDVRAVLEDGRTFVADDHDICAGPRWAISSGTRR